MEFIGKAQMAHPIFQVQNEGPDNAEFRCTLFVGGKVFTLRETFCRLKDLEHQTSKLVLESTRQLNIPYSPAHPYS